VKHKKKKMIKLVEMVISHLQGSAVEAAELVRE